MGPNNLSRQLNELTGRFKADDRPGGGYWDSPSSNRRSAHSRSASGTPVGPLDPSTPVAAPSSRPPPTEDAPGEASPSPSQRSFRLGGGSPPHTAAAANPAPRNSPSTSSRHSAEPSRTKKLHARTHSRTDLSSGEQTPPPPPSHHHSQTRMSSQRNRPRGPNRNSEVGVHGEEAQLWGSLQGKLREIVDKVNESSENTSGIQEADSTAAEKTQKGHLTNELLNNLDNILRQGVKINDNATALLSSTLEELQVLRAIQRAKEESSEQPSSRTSGQRSKETAAPTASVYDFDAAGDSPVPSPNPNSRRMGGSSGSTKGDRDSVPPKLDRSTPAAKAGSVEPQGGPAGAIARSKVNFVKGDEVAFKPKLASNEQTDWILGIVQEVRGEGKSRRYRVLDADVDENGHQKDFRTSASAMIPIPKEGTGLPPLDAGKTVLALYPNTTTFYKAEVMGMDEDGQVNLKFEGEESSNTTQGVKRRYVVEYRG